MMQSSVTSKGQVIRPTGSEMIANVALAPNLSSSLLGSGYPQGDKNRQETRQQPPPFHDCPGRILPATLPHRTPWFTSAIPEILRGGDREFGQARWRDTASSAGGVPSYSGPRPGNRFGRS